ncbi:GNAT family N-acetyltransferase [Peribacillus alkalitolerans]|uniref:GNAT family N-acetyltransferase n=1 Tax=Peribacillus alkalitolerans TaxID=1550385 RepID=UPI001F076E15|nr:GNAT family N-acetyltransferase [Peribacillus alkalitolerans]
MEFKKNYKDNPSIRNSFFELAQEVFGIRFESWFQCGYWTDKYLPFSFLIGDKVIANVSVNKVGLIVNGAKMKSLQIGTVMTHPDFRGNGVSKKLMEHVLEEFEDEYDILYLFANHSVLDYYPKFGFKAVDECQYYMNYIPTVPDGSNVKKLNIESDRDFLYQFAAERMPVSNLFSSYDTQELLMFYSLNVFSEDIYYLGDEDVIVIYQVDEETLHIYDIISKSEVHIHRILKRIASSKTKKVVFHFTPEFKEIKLKTEKYVGSEVLFIKTKEGISLTTKFKHPMTAQA